jgi:DNA polymerase III subunit epsilon
MTINHLDRLLRLINSFLRLGRNAASSDPTIGKNKGLFEKFSDAGPIEMYDFVSFDTELTGLNPRKDEIVSIGAVKIRNLKILLGDYFFSYVRPQRDLPKDSTLIHRITPEQIRSAPTPDAVMPEFVEYCGDALLVGHFVTLDMAFLNKAMRRHLNGTMHNPYIDSMRLAQVYQEQLRAQGRGKMRTETSLNLAALSTEYNLPTFERHDALEDAVQTAYLFLFLVKELKESGYKRLRDFRSVRSGIVAET